MPNNHVNQRLIISTCSNYQHLLAANCKQKPSLTIYVNIGSEEAIATPLRYSHTTKDSTNQRTFLFILCFSFVNR